MTPSRVKPQIWKRRSAAKKRLNVSGTEFTGCRCERSWRASDTVEAKNGDECITVVKRVAPNQFELIVVVERSDGFLCRPVGSDETVTFRPSASPMTTIPGEVVTMAERRGPGHI